MNPPVRLSPAHVQTAIRRHAPRPIELRNAIYAERFDWKTLFYDVYRAGPDVVLQGPPLFNLFEHLRESDLFEGAFRRLFPRARHFGQKKRGEIWLRTDADRIAFSGPLGSFDLEVQPEEHHRFAGRRVLLTQSKDNEIRWIIDWARFHRELHGADALLLYDNASTCYDSGELRCRLAEALPGMAIEVLDWPYIFGPQAGPGWAANGIEPDWDSDYCQVGVLQHARFRFLRDARSVMHNDVDELVIGNRGRGVFEAAEKSRNGLVKFDGRWISVVCESAIDRAQCRHADFIFDEGAQLPNSPAKWCIRPQAFSRKISWGVHNIFGGKGNDRIDDEFLFRHFRGITTNWNYERWSDDRLDCSTLLRDDGLIAAMRAGGLKAGADEVSARRAVA